MASEEDNRFHAASRYFLLAIGHTIGVLIAVDTGQPVLLPFRMSCFVLSNLVVTAGMLTPGLGVWLSRAKIEDIC